MAYPPRFEHVDAVFHVVASGNNDSRIFYGGVDYETCLLILDRVCKRRGWMLLAYCLMGNHIHLVVLTPEANLAAGMHQFLSPYARAFNGEHGRKGHVFGRRYWSRLVMGEADLQATLAYVACNPPAGRFCSSPSAWEWNSYTAVRGQALTPPCLDVERLFAYFDPDPVTARSKYVALVEGRWAELQARREAPPPATA